LNKLLRHRKGSFFWLVVASVFFRLQLEFAYTSFVSPLYYYAGFASIENPDKYIESWLLFSAGLMTLSGRTKRPSDYIILFGFFCFLTPLLVFYGEADANRPALYFVLLQYLLMVAFRSKFVIRTPTISNGDSSVKSISIAGIIIATIWMLASVGVTNFSLDIETVYEFRENANNSIYTGPMGYLVAWVTSVCSAVLLMLCLRDKKYFLCLGIGLLHVFWFGITTHKSVLFYPIQVACIYAVLRSTKSSAAIPLGLSVVVLISQVMFELTESIVLSSLFVRRIFFVPSHLTFTYFEFFENNPMVYWSNSFMSWINKYPYNESTALVIGNYLNDPTLWANNSFFATGYMHAGLVGVTIYGVVAGIILSILDSYSRNGTPIWMVVSVTIVPFYTLFTSADLTTTLLTHGLGFGMLVLAFMNGKASPKMKPAENFGVQGPQGTP
jgi:hypothetical protein